MCTQKMARQENFLSSTVSCVIRLRWCSSLISIHSQFQVLIQSHRKFAVSANYRKITANYVCFMSWEEEGNVPLISQLSQIGCSLGFFVIIQIWKSVYNFFVHHSLSNNSVDLHPPSDPLAMGPTRTYLRQLLRLLARCSGRGLWRLPGAQRQTG